MNGTLGDYAKIILGGTPKTSNKEFWDGDIPWVTPGDIGDTKHIPSTARSITEAGLQGSNTKLLDHGDVVISARGTVGKVMECDQPIAFNQSCYAIRTLDAEVLHQGYVYYLIHDCVNYLRQNAGGAVFNAIVMSTLARTPVKIPMLDKQKRIASILSAYDDLIENNRRRIQLLEQAARLLYREWFVYFRFPGHEHVKIKDGVPEGWEKKKITDVCETVGGGTPSTKVSEYWEGDITWVVPSDITKNNCLVLLDSERKITEKGLRKSSAKMVPAETILMTSRASVGFFALMDYEVCTNQGFINIIPHKDGLRMYLLFNLMNRVTEIRSNAKGTTYPEISKGRFRGMDIIIPSNTLVTEYERIASNIIQQVRRLKQSIFKLKVARDLLLPRLMNGEVVV